MRYVTHVLAAILFFSAAPALAQEENAAEYAVLESDARISFPSAINGFERLSENEFLLRVGASRLYRATVAPACARGANVYFQIGLEPSTPFGFDRRSSLRLDDFRTCRLRSLERVERLETEVAPGA